VAPASSARTIHDMEPGDEKNVLERVLEVCTRTEGTVESVRHDQHVMRRQISSIEGRMGRLEKADDQHVESIRAGSESDSKLFSDQAALVIAIERTRSDSAASAERLEKKIAEAAEAAKIEASEAAKSAAAENKKLAEAALAAAQEAGAKIDKADRAIVVARDETKQQTPMIQEIQKQRIPGYLAAIVNLLAVLAYIVELLRNAKH
jgi:hypothetical protein